MAGQEEGIKLFGATITMHGRGVVSEEEQTKENPTIDKRPEKIIQCPRCKSMETKFCYFNNYNVNQPRHFCKGCQRYWTAGGALRNVPVGAGRRKTKPPSTGCSWWVSRGVLVRLLWWDTPIGARWEFFWRSGTWQQPMAVSVKFSP
ncbi:hypothetical protein OIU77_009309 [Salix suchowensis]|uniref:Dof-type domain-containing protein n=1 Tax=Salix suchowensis TaxID=1278906 RepID=A0ABQ9AG49_9ROSI|nr:hypothetical protein OIU77_009309 [Salix suchowensis]